MKSELEKIVQTCRYCKKREVEKDCLFVYLCKECCGQNELELKIKKAVKKKLEDELGYLWYDEQQRWQRFWKELGVEEK